MHQLVPEGKVVSGDRDLHQPPPIHFIKVRTFYLERYLVYIDWQKMTERLKHRDILSPRVRGS
jgi:hypothetical protein